MRDFCSKMSYFRHCSNKLFWLKETLCHHGINAAWRTCLRVEVEELSYLLSVSGKKLENILAHAARNVPYYRQWFSSHGGLPLSISIKDFPIVTKQDIKGHEADFIADGWNNRLHWARTSGSTGEPFRFARSEYDYSYATLWRGLARWGIRPGDKRALVKGVDETAIVSKRARTKRMLYEWINRCVVVDAHFLAKSDKNVEQELHRILKYKPDYFHGYASSIYLLACYAESHNLDCSRLHLKAVVTESEKCYEFQREVIERVFHAPVVENYGSMEFGMIAQPADDRRLCINNDHVYIETTDTHEAVITNLDEYGFPLIRFKNGDKLTLGQAHEKLPYRTIENIEGRIAETIHLPQGGSLQGYIVMYPISKHLKYLREYQVYQPNISNLYVRIVESEPMPKEIESQIVSEMRSVVGNVINVHIEKVMSIPLTKRGKRAFVCSDVHTTNKERR